MQKPNPRWAHRVDREAAAAVDESPEVRFWMQSNRCAYRAKIKTIKVTL